MIDRTEIAINVNSLIDVSTYIYFDGPRFYSGWSDDRETLFLVVQIDEDEDDSWQWLVGEDLTGGEILDEMTSGKITLRETWRKLSHLRIVSDGPHCVNWVHAIQYSDLTAEQLPDVMARFPQRA